MKRNDIAVGVVTFNRLELLKKVIGGIRNQTVIPGAIYVINNSSSDGTADWLAKQDDLTVVTQDNLGSSGGQWRSVKEMYEAGYEWIWIMDDDVVPTPECLENLIAGMNKNEVRAPQRYGFDGKVYINDTIRFNMTNPFKSMWLQIFSEDLHKENVIPCEGITFEGPIFHRSLVDKVGLPIKDFFIFGDDTEYMMKAHSVNYKTQLIRDARLDRLLPAPNDNEFSWKHYYIIRNTMILDVLYGNTPVRVIRPFLYLLKWLTKARSLKNIITCFRAFRDGYFYKRKDN
jgi:GT2 family glycosyltransferase